MDISRHTQMTLPFRHGLPSDNDRCERDKPQVDNHSRSVPCAAMGRSGTHNLQEPFRCE